MLCASPLTGNAPQMGDFMSLDILDMATSDILALIPRCIDFISTGERHPMQAVFTACACLTRALVA